MVDSRLWLTGLHFALGLVAEGLSSGSTKARVSFKEFVRVRTFSDKASPSGVTHIASVNPPQKDYYTHIRGSDVWVDNGPILRKSPASMTYGEYMRYVDGGANTPSSQPITVKQPEIPIPIIRETARVPIISVVDVELDISEASIPVYQGFKVKMFRDNKNVGKLQINTSIGYIWDHWSRDIAGLLEEIPNPLVASPTYGESVKLTRVAPNQTVIFGEVYRHTLHRFPMMISDKTYPNDQPHESGQLGLGQQSLLVKHDSMVLFPSEDSGMRLGFSKKGSDRYCIPNQIVTPVVLSRLNDRNWDVSGMVSIGSNGRVSFAHAQSGHIRIQSSVNYIELEASIGARFMEHMRSRGYVLRDGIVSSDGKTKPYILIENCRKSVFTDAPDIVYGLKNSVTVSVRPANYIEEGIVDGQNYFCYARIRIQDEINVFVAGMPFLLSAVTVFERDNNGLPAMSVCQAKF